MYTFSFLLLIVLSVTTLSNSSRDKIERDFHHWNRNNVRRESSTSPVNKFNYYFHKNWPDGKVIYEVSTDFNETQKMSLLKAMQDFERKTCIKFQKRKSETKYLSINMNHGNGCSTDTAHEIHVMSMDPSWCLKHGRILHELMHSLGFTHEHQRPDRDSHIVIFWHNIRKDQRDQFKRKDYPLSDTYGFPYDYTSILHYANWSQYAAIDSSKYIILPLIPEPNMGQRISLNQMDVDKINLFYKCKVKSQYKRFNI